MDLTMRNSQEAQFRQVVEMAPNAMVMIDKTGTIELVNAQAEKIFGYARKELLGQSIDMLLPERFRSQHPGHRQLFFGKPSPRAMGSGRDLFGRRKDGSELPVEIGLNPITTAEGVKVLAAIVDISERKRQEAQFRQVVEMAPNAMVMIDKSGVIELVNAQAEKIFGYTREELLGQSIDMLLPERFRSMHPEHRELFFSAPSPRAMGSGRDLFGRRKDGTEFSVEIGLNPIATADSVKVLAAIVDISERKRQEAQFRQVVEMAPNAMVMIDKTGVIELVNAQAEKIFGYTREELLGQSIDMLLPERFRAQHPQHRELFFNQPSPRTMGSGRDLFGRRKDGSELPVEIGLNPIATAEGVKVLAAIVDISERKQAELRQQELITELTRINEELNHFAYVSSHDLKSPLRGIDQLATWIEEDLEDSLNEDTQSHLRLMRSRIKRMEMLLDDLLAYSRVGRMDGELVTVNTRSLVLDAFELIGTAKPIELHVAADLPVLQTRKVPLELVFRNLLSNAIKHNDKDHGHITVSARMTANEVEFSVQDNGPGIPREHQVRVFGMFQTLKPRDEVEGSGIGLALVKKSVETVGGKVHLESDGQTGCVFRFTWPRLLR